MIVVQEVTTKKEMRKFCNFPLQLYKGVSYYCPPFYADELALFDPKKKGMYSDFADTKFYLAYKDGKIVGRLGAMINHAYIEKIGRKCARFTRFDVIDDFEVSRALFEAGEKYLKDNGMTEIHGPMGYTDLDREGLLVEGFDYRATYGSSYNFPYYVEHIEKLGFVKEVDWLERRITIPQEPSRKVQQVAKLVRDRYHLRDVVTNKSSISKMINIYAVQIFELLDLCYEDLPGVIPITERVRNATISQIKIILSSKFISLIVNDKDELVGFGMLFASMVEALNKSGGKLFPTGAFRILRSLKKVEEVELALICCHPDYQKMGVTALIMDRVMNNLIVDGVKFAETNLNYEGNTSINNLWHSYESIQHKRKRCFIKSL